MHHSHRTLRADDQEFKHAVEEALQWVEDAEQLPKLSLFQGNGDEDRGIDMLLEVPAGGDGDHCEAAASPCGNATQVDLPETDTDFSEGDQSATQDVILCEPPAANDRMLQLAFDGGSPSEDREQDQESEPEAMAEKADEPAPAQEQNLPFRPITTKKAHTLRPGKTPDRIGQGKLVSARLTWKPGDPFSDGKPRPAERFSWESMLTSACITAACGLFCVWLLRSILA